MLMLDGDAQSPSLCDGRSKQSSPTEECPPDYSASPMVASPAESLTSSRDVPPTPIGVKPANFLSVVRHRQPIKGTYVVDPMLVIPATFLPPLPEGDTVRKNLRLEAQFSYIDVDLWLVPAPTTPPGAPPVERATISLRSSKSSVAVSMHSTSTTAPPHPFILTATTSAHQSITLCVPRTFRGPVTLTSRHGALSTSPDLSAQLTIFSEEKSTVRGFVGEFSGKYDNSDVDLGSDELVLETNGAVRLSYTDEMQDAQAKWGRRATKRLFSDRRSK